MSTSAKGVLYTISAYLLWGLSPIFWKWLRNVPPSELVAHRILWSGLFLILVLTWQGRWESLRRVVAARRSFLPLVGSTILIASNWFTFIWAISHERVLEASLGYFINPLVNVLLGTLLLRERLRAWQWASVALAAGGVVVLTFRFGRVPWLALFLAFSFAIYGLVCKTVAASPEEGVAIETWLLSPFALVFLGSLLARGGGAVGHADVATFGLLAGTGLITAVPLIWFSHGARRLPFSTIGILQYLAPTCQFVLAVSVFHEPFERAHLLAFLAIWIAIVLFTADALVAARSSRRRLRFEARLP